MHFYSHSSQSVFFISRGVFSFHFSLPVHRSFPAVTDRLNNQIRPLSGRIANVHRVQCQIWFGDSVCNVVIKFLE